jgi:hypothetical protein
MLVGTANVEELLQSQATATIAQFGRDPIRFDDVSCFQMTVEMRNRAREAILPKSLHPTVPAALSLQVWSVGASPWGAFRMAVVRAACRSGVRARGFTLAAFASTASAREALRAQFGFPARVAAVRLRHGYDGVDASVAIDERISIAVRANDPEPMSNDDVQYTGTLNLAHTPNGLRLVQLEADHVATRIERLTAHLVTFDGATCGSALLDPYLVVSSSLALETVTFPPIRFVCKVDELAFTGTEAVAAQSHAVDG